MNKIKEMVYKNKRERELLYDNKYRNYHFYIMSLGTHPTAYIEIPKGNKLYEVDYHNINIEVHGGLTYSDNFLIIGDKQIIGWFIGWDYAHYNDYIGGIDKFNELFNKLGLGGDENGKKWTTEEIIEDCFKVIDQVIEVENNEKNCN